jgi:hypothetical protein
LPVSNRRGCCTSRQNSGRHGRDVGAIELQKIEGEIDQCSAAAVGGLLHDLERGHAVQPDAAQLPVDIGCFDRELGQGCRSRRVPCCWILSTWARRRANVTVPCAAWRRPSPKHFFARRSEQYAGRFHLSPNASDNLLGDLGRKQKVVFWSRFNIKGDLIGREPQELAMASRLAGFPSPSVQFSLFR